VDDVGSVKLESVCNHPNHIFDTDLILLRHLQRCMRVCVCMRACAYVQCADSKGANDEL
jgi:hypothetical protein